MNNLKAFYKKHENKILLIAALVAATLLVIGIGGLV